jgi:hypothetical protein
LLDNRLAIQCIGRLIASLAHNDLRVHNVRVWIHIVSQRRHGLRRDAPGELPTGADLRFASQFLRHPHQVALVSMSYSWVPHVCIFACHSQNIRSESSQRSASVDEPPPSTATTLNVPSTVIESDAMTTPDTPKTVKGAVDADNRLTTANSKRSSAARWSNGVFVSIDNNNCGDNAKQPKIDLDDVTDALDDVINVGVGQCLDDGGDVVRNVDGDNQDDDAEMMVTYFNGDAFADDVGARRNDRRRKMQDAVGDERVIRTIDHIKQESGNDTTATGARFSHDIANTSSTSPPSPLNGNAIMYGMPRGLLSA